MLWTCRSSISPNKLVFQCRHRPVARPFKRGVHMQVQRIFCCCTNCSPLPPWACREYFDGTWSLVIQWCGHAIISLKNGVHMHSLQPETLHSWLWFSGFTSYVSKLVFYKIDKGQPYNQHFFCPENPCHAWGCCSAMTAKFTPTSLWWSFDLNLFMLLKEHISKPEEVIKLMKR